MTDPYLYPGTTVLKNILDIRTQETLDEAEADYVSLRLRELAENPLIGKYDLQHYLNFHKYIFQDIYDWAGKPRVVNMIKPEPILGGISIDYSKHDKIVNDLEKEINIVASINWGQDVGSLTKKLASSMADIWKIHAFREGNTRTTITFFCQLIDEKLKSANRKIFEENAVYVRTALVAYCANFGKGGDYSKKQYLENIIKDAIS